MRLMMSFVLPTESKTFSQLRHHRTEVDFTAITAPRLISRNCATGHAEKQTCRFLARFFLGART